MGEAVINLVKLDLDRPNQLVLNLSEQGKSEYLGQLALTVGLEPKTSTARSSSIVSSLCSTTGSIR